MNKLLNNSDYRLIFFLFFSWKITLVVVAFFSFSYIPLNSSNFLGGGLSNYLNSPLIFSLANFDGEHYLNIAQNGYQNLEHSFFPLYPYSIQLLSFFSRDLFLLTIIGLIISNLTFFISLIYLWKLVILDYSKKIALIVIILLILFPTSFYFGAVYTESFFLLLTLISVYFARTNKRWLSGFAAGLASAVRVTGILILPLLVVEWWQKNKSANNLAKVKTFIPLLLAPLGLISYMLFLYRRVGDPLAFYRELSIFGVQRQGHFILLPQVFYRYINILTTVNLNTYNYWISAQEFLSAVLCIICLYLGFKFKVRLSYLTYFFLAFLLPTLTGSFSSLPRYILVIFPLFLTLAIFLSKKSFKIKTSLFILIGILLIIQSALFLRGYWIS